MDPFRPGAIRVFNDKIYIKSAAGNDTSFDIAPLSKAVPYYRNFREHLNLKVTQRWPVEVLRRFLFDFKQPIDAYVARPNRTTQGQLLNRIDMVIGKAIEPPKI